MIHLVFSCHNKNRLFSEEPCFFSWSFIRLNLILLISKSSYELWLFTSQIQVCKDSRKSTEDTQIRYPQTDKACSTQKEKIHLKRQLPPSWNFHVCGWVYLEAKNLQFLAFQHFNFNGPASLVDEDTQAQPPSSMRPHWMQRKHFWPGCWVKWRLCGALVVSQIYIEKFVRDKPAQPASLMVVDGYLIGNPEWDIYWIFHDQYEELLASFLQGEVASFRGTPWM